VDRRSAEPIRDPEVINVLKVHAIRQAFRRDIHPLAVPESTPTPASPRPKGAVLVGGPDVWEVVREDRATREADRVETESLAAYERTRQLMSS